MLQMNKLNMCHINMLQNYLFQMKKLIVINFFRHYPEEKIKIQLLKLLMQDPDLLLLDEPTRNFSPLSQPELLELFKKYEGTIISVSHDRTFLNQVCSKIYKLTSDSLNLL